MTMFDHQQHVRGPVVGGDAKGCLAMDRLVQPSLGNRAEGLGRGATAKAGARQVTRSVGQAQRHRGAGVKDGKGRAVLMSRIIPQLRKPAQRDGTRTSGRPRCVGACAPPRPTRRNYAP